MELDGHLSTVMLRLLWPWPSNFWPNHYIISGAGTYMIQFWWKYLRRYRIHPVFRVIVCGDLDFWPLIPKANQHMCDQNWVKCPSLDCEISVHKVFDTYTVHQIGESIVQIFMKILYSTGFGVIAYCNLDLWPLTRKANQQYEPEYICDQNWVKFLSLVCEIWFSQGFRVIACCGRDLWPFDHKI